MDINIHRDYFNKTQQLYSQYGKKSIVLMQVGAFFEVYGLKDNNDTISGSEIIDFTTLCGLNISEKTSFDYVDIDGKKTILMAGFRDFMLDKYLIKLADNGYTVAVYIQEKQGKTITRKLDKIYSSGTYISNEIESDNKLSNNIMCIWMEKIKPYSNNTQNKRQLLVSGASVINIFTGDVFTFQYEIPFYMNVNTFDELERFISTYTPSEVIIINNFMKNELTKMIDYTGIQTENIHFVETTNDKCEKCANQKYIKEIISRIYNEDAYDTYTDFNEYIVATQSLCYLFDFIQEHNPNIIKNLKLPRYNNVSNNILLANHTLKQLNILPDNNKTGIKSSIMTFLNKCNTPMGKRLFQYQITHPTVDTEWLNIEYNAIDILTDNFMYKRMLSWRTDLYKIRDIDKYLRQLSLKILLPSSMYNLFISINTFNSLMSQVEINEWITNYISLEQDKGKKKINTEIKSVLTFIKKYLHIYDCKSLNSMSNFSTNIIKREVNVDLDNLSDQHNNLLSILTSIKYSMNKLIQNEENTDTEYIKIHETEKSGLSLQMTSKRSDILKKILKVKPIIINIHNESFEVKNIFFTKASATNVDINFELLNYKDIHTLCRMILHTKTQLNELIAQTYLTVMHYMEEQIFTNIEYVSKVISKLDVIISKSYCAKEFKYTKPNIVEDEEKSFIEAKGLRHCLIEQLQENELYVENDIQLGKDNQDGILLYGTNAVGKTSLIRAIGIAVIMAQCGMYVPCSQCNYKPYTAIFSRIIGNDNLFKGLSTFAVEMSELRTILNLSDNNSLILGDELCSGTETESALSIFVSGLMHLYKKQGSFIFATHFHEITEFTEINSMSSINLKHLEVVYDPEQDCLIYDRKLKDGSGPRIYGLEVCKSLYMDPFFLDTAFNIRNKYFSNTRGVLSNQTSAYNAAKIKGICELCNKKLGTEIHHLQQQKDADDEGFIGNIHKNHKANLISICTECHDNIHSNNKEYIKKKTTKGYKLIST